MIRGLFKAVSFFFSIIRRFVRYAFRGSAVLVLVIMLAVNVASLTIGSLNAFLSSVIETVGGLDTIRKKSNAKTAELEGNLKKSRADLDLERGKTKYLANKTGKLEVENRRLRVNGPDVKFRGRTRSMRSVVEETTGLIERRTAKVAATNVGAMAGEGIPFWGIAVIVAATTYEVTTACDTMKDMHDLSVALSPGSADDAEVKRVCGMRVPTREEIWASIKAGPQAVWDGTQRTFSNLPSPDFSGLWMWVTEKLSWN